LSSTQLWGNSMNNDAFLAAFTDELEKIASCDGTYNDVFWAAFDDEMEKGAIAPLLIDAGAAAAKWGAKAPFRAIGAIPYGPRKATPRHAAGQVIGTRKTWYGGTKPVVAKGYTRMTVGRKARSLYDKVRHPIKTIKRNRKNRRRIGRYEEKVRKIENALVDARPQYHAAQEALKKLNAKYPEEALKKLPKELKEKALSQKKRLIKQMQPYAALTGARDDLQRKASMYRKNFGNAIKPSKTKRAIKGIKKKLGLGRYRKKTEKATPVPPSAPRESRAPQQSERTPEAPAPTPRRRERPRAEAPRERELAGAAT